MVESGDAEPMGERVIGEIGVYAGGGEEGVFVGPWTGFRG